MPIYNYRHVPYSLPGDSSASKGKSGCDKCLEGFEVIQKMSDPPVESCPECDASVKRVPSGFSVGKGGPPRNLMSDSNLEKHGFTKLTKQRNGDYKVTGADPGGIGKVKRPIPE